jgi:predicted PurR-regulated permease PerM
MFLLFFFLRDGETMAEQVSSSCPRAGGTPRDDAPAQGDARLDLQARS